MRYDPVITAGTVENLEALGFCFEPLNGRLVPAGGAETKGFLLPVTGSGVGTQATAPRVRSGTVALGGATPHTGPAKLAAHPRKAGGCQWSALGTRVGFDGWLFAARKYDASGACKYGLRWPPFKADLHIDRRQPG